MTHQLAGKRVLIVEDNAFIAMSLADELAAVGANVVDWVGTVSAALDVIASTYVDGVILDLSLQGKSAFPVADALADRHIPFVFATGLEANQIPARYAKVPRLEKPTASGVVCRTLEGAISGTP